MTENDGATIPMHALGAEGIDRPVPVASQKKASWKLPSLSLVVTVLVSLAAVGGGTWYYLHPAAIVEDDESIADIEGFDLAPPFTGEISRPRSESSAGFASLTEVTVPELPPSPSMMNSNEVGVPEVWFSGIIEEAEPVETLELPKRLSGGPGESTIFR